MNREQFNALVTRLQKASERNPRAYNVRVAALTLLGYSYLIGVLLVSVLLTIGIIAMMIAYPHFGTIKLGIIFGLATGGLAIALAKALWVRFDAPEGIPLTRSDSPELFDSLDRLRAKFKGPCFHEVLLTGDYNAAVVQLPRLGVFGWQRNYLIVGLPLLQSHSPEEFEAVLAHEFGHLSGNHARFGAWIYRVRRTWERVFEEMATREHRGTFVLRKFVDWFWPLFNGHAFVLARANEYEADRCSAEFCDSKTAAAALIRTSLHGSLLDQSFWPAIYSRTNTEAQPPQSIYSEMATALQGQVNPTDSERWLKTAFVLETNTADTHPCLKDRLRALSALPDGLSSNQYSTLLPAVTRRAADKFLGSKSALWAGKLSEIWHKNISEIWEQRRKHVTELEKEIAKASETGSTPPDAEQLWRKARAIMDRDGDKAAVPAIEQVLSLDPCHAPANFVMGRYLLESDDAAGVPWIERAIVSDEALTESGCELLYGFYARTGQREQLSQLENRIDKFRERTVADLEERNNFKTTDVFLPHQLNPETIERMNKVFAAENEVSSVCVARKHLTIFPKYPLLVLSVTVKVAWWKPRGSSADQKLVNRLTDNLQMETQSLMFINGDNFKPIGKKVSAVPGSKIYVRGSSVNSK